MHFHCFSTTEPVTTRFQLWMGPFFCPRQEQAFIAFCGQTRMFPSWFFSQLYPKKYFLSCCFFRAFGEENKVGNPAHQTHSLFSDLRLVFCPAWVAAVGVAQFCLPSPPAFLVTTRMTVQRQCSAVGCFLCVSLLLYFDICECSHPLTRRQSLDFKGNHCLQRQCQMNMGPVFYPFRPTGK